MNDLEQVRRAEQAKYLLENPVHDEAWDAIRARLFEIMEAAQTDEAVLRAKLAINLLTDVKGYWLRIVKDGAVAAGTIQMEAEKRKWWQRAA